MRYERLKEIREQRELTQKEIAGILEIDQRVYSIYETGKREIPCRHLITLAEYYNVSTDYLLGRTDIKTFRRQ